MGSDVSHPEANSFIKRRGSSKKMPRRLSMGPPNMGEPQQDPPSIRVGSGSTGVLNDDENEGEVQYTGSQSSRHSLSTDQLNTPRSRSGSSGDQSPTKAAKHRCTLSYKNRQLIQSCFNNPHENIGVRILKRAAERRKDFGRFYMAVSAEQREQIADTIKVLLKKSVAGIHNADEELQMMAAETGQRFVEYRSLGFKADYFAVLADSTITECVLLDAAVHPAATTLSAFSQFITMLFSSVRDGFYQEMRRMRRISNSFSIHSNGSSRKKLSVEDALKAAEKLHQNAAAENATSGNGNLSANASPRSLSPAADEVAVAANNKKRNSIEMGRKSPSSFGSSSQEIEEENEQQLNELNNNSNSGQNNGGSKNVHIKSGIKMAFRNKFGNKKCGTALTRSNGSNAKRDRSKSPSPRKFSPPSSIGSDGEKYPAFAKESSVGSAGEQQQPPRMTAAVAH